MGACRRSKSGEKRWKLGKCRPIADNTACDGAGRFLDGACNPQPQCLPAGSGCSTTAQEACCSDVCEARVSTFGSCGKGRAGSECLTENDCLSGSCVGFRCR
jgi:hypothetical protein